MDCRKIALTLGLASSMSFASVSLSFYEKTDGYTTTNATVKLVGNSLIYKGDIREVRALSVYDALGNKVYSMKNVESPTMNLEFLDQGVYVVKIQTTSKNSSFKFTKK